MQGAREVEKIIFLRSNHFIHILIDMFAFVPKNVKYLARSIVIPNVRAPTQFTGTVVLNNTVDYRLSVLSSTSSPVVRAKLSTLSNFLVSR